MNHVAWPMPEFDMETAFVDVDGTLLLWPSGAVGEGTPAPNTALVRRLRAWKAKDRRIYLWSRGGESHARQAAAFCDASDLFDAFLNKPSVMIDDAHRWMERVKREAP